MLPMNAVDQNLEGGVRQEVTQLDLDSDSWKDSELALSYISEEGNIYYYRRIPAFDSTISSDTRQVDWRMVDRIGNHFPPTVPYQPGDDIELAFDVYVNSSLRARAICVWVTYDVTGDCETSCHANVSTRYIYSDWGDATVQDGHIHVDVNGTTNTEQEDDAPASNNRANGPLDIHIHVEISNAQSYHGGQYVCNVYTEPFSHGASFHTQTKLLFENATNMWPYGFILAEMSVCGNVTSLQSSGNAEGRLQSAVIPAGLDNCLLCYGAGNPSPNITFTKDGEFLPHNSETFMVEPEDDQDFQAATYILRDVTPDDAGEYACVVTNGVTQSTHALNITVREMWNALLRADFRFASNQWEMYGVNLQRRLWLAGRKARIGPDCCMFWLDTVNKAYGYIIFIYCKRLTSNAAQILIASISVVLESMSLPLVS